MKIGPAISFEDIHPPRTAFLAASRLDQLLPLQYEHWHVEYLSGTALICLGAMPAACHRNMTTDAALDFFRLSGLELPAHLEAYGSDGEAVASARKMAAAGLKFATIYPQLPEIGALDASLVAPALYDHLNDKRNMAELCPPEWMPARRIVGREDARALKAGGIDFPVFLKGAVEGANGAGKDVRFCADAEAFADALSWFDAKPYFKALIIEAAIPFTASWCLHFAILDNEVRYLGGAEQLFSGPGAQVASLIDPANPPPQAAVEMGIEIGAAAQARGYRGIAGFDMCTDAAGRIYFFDLNFRLCSSTCFVLLQGGLEDRRQVSLTAAITRPGRLTDLLPRLEDLALRKLFIPLQLYDGSAHETPPAPSRILGFFRGENRGAAEALVREAQTRLAV